jgi:hypothetical protein
MAKRSSYTALALALLALGSCAPRAALTPATQESSRTEREAVSRTTELRDTTLRLSLPQESRTNAVPLPDSVRERPVGLWCTPVSHLTTRHAESSAWVENGVLRHDLHTANEELLQRVPNAIRVVREDRRVTRTLTVRTTVTVNALTAAQRRWIALGRTAAGLLSLLLLAAVTLAFKRWWR